MGPIKTRFKIRLLGALALLVWLPAALAFEPFIIKEIRASGLERLDVGTVLTYLPLSAGDEIDQRLAQQALRGLYSSGLFNDVRLERKGETLLIYVRERPAISTFEIEGNKKVGGEELMESLTSLGLAEGELFKRELLNGVEQELQRQYYANGYYDVDIDTQVLPLPNNRVDIKIDVTEGKSTTIRDINVIGNKVYSRKDLLDVFELEKSNSWDPLQKTDKYSKQQLGGDLENLSAYYHDSGYLRFEVSSVQVQLSPTKEDIYITVNVEEGERYEVSETRFTGETVLQPEFLKLFLSTQPGDWFSRRKSTESANRIEAALSDVGYAFAEVTPVPEVEDGTKKVAINYVVEAGKRAYVRRITFAGHGRTHDETLRREMRQLEAAPFSKSAVERSRVRLARLPFVEEAEVDTRPVPGTDDLIDVSFTIKERPPGSIQFGVGFSGSQGFLINSSLTHTNFLGTGNRVSVEANTNSVQRALSLSWTDPYFTQDGISQTISGFFRKTESIIRQSSGFNFNTLGATLTYGIPLSEYSALRAGIGIDRTAIDTFAFSSSDQILGFVIRNGTEFNNVELRTGITRDTRNRTFFASRGTLNQLGIDLKIPGSDLEYYTVNYRLQHYVHLYRKFFVEINANVSLADDYGNDSEAPPYEHFFAGGPRTVRGYDDGSLGPRDTPFDNPFGGRLRTTSQSELVIPMPIESDQRTTRLAFFYDIGQVYPDISDFSAGELRSSYGISFKWYTPFLGLLDLSYAFPINDRPGDETDSFQIRFGGGF